MESVLSLNYTCKLPVSDESVMSQHLIEQHRIDSHFQGFDLWQRIQKGPFLKLDGAVKMEDYRFSVMQ